MAEEFGSFLGVMHMVDLVGLMAISTAFFIVAASPGPATLATATVSMRSGRSSGLRFGIGLSVGLAFWGLIAATGMGAVLQASTFALTALKILGGAYLLWLALKSARSACQNAQAIATPDTKGRWFRRGLILNLSNPKAVVAWMATLSLGVGDGIGFWQIAFATSVCIVLGFLIYAGYAFVFSMSGAMSGYARVRKWIDGMVAGFFAIVGAGLIRSAFAK
ncbi:MAG: LysE family translocator [Boseongicola sp.]